MLSKSDQEKIAAFLDGRHIPFGLGDEESACSIAAINLALTGTLTDDIPDCMSEVVGRWIIVVQDAMPDEMRNSKEWRRLLPLAAGTGREREKERLDLVLSWMWETVLPFLLPVAEKHGFKVQWETMLTGRTAADAARAADAALAADAYAAADAAAYAAAARAAAAAADAARAARAAARAATADADAARAMWKKFDPVGLLAKLVEE